MQTFGECTVAIGGQRRTLRGEAEIHGTGLSTEVQANEDGSVYQTAKTAPCTLKVDLEDEIGAELTAADMIAPHDITFIETQSGRRHLFSSAKIAGDPTYNPATGALTGITFACARGDYRRTNL